MSSVLSAAGSAPTPLASPRALALSGLLLLRLART